MGLWDAGEEAQRFQDEAMVENDPLQDRRTPRTPKSQTRNRLKIDKP